MKNNSLLKGNAIFEKYIRKNFIKYILILLVYLSGFLIGIGIFNNNINNLELSNELSMYVTGKLESISLETSKVIGNYMKQDFSELLIISILSFSMLGIPVIVILLFSKALSLGATVSSLIHVSGVGNGLSFSILVFMIPVLIKIFVLLMMVSSSFKFVENILKYKKEVKYEIVRHALTNLIALFLFGIIVLYRYISLNMVSQILF